MDNQIWQAIWRWAKRRHPHKGNPWIKDKYFISKGSRNWVFATEARQTPEKGKPSWAYLLKASDIPIRRHVKVKEYANPFDPQWGRYFEERQTLKMNNSLEGRKRLRALWLQQSGICPICDQKLTEECGWHTHHILPRVKGGDDRQSNLLMVHPNCHSQLHNPRFDVVKSAPKLGL